MADHVVGVTIDGKPVTYTNLFAVYGLGDSVRIQLEVTLPGWMLSGTPVAEQPPPPRDDIVQHLGTRCCCRNCPAGGDHA